MDWTHRMTSTVTYASQTYSSGDFTIGATSTASARIVEVDKIVKTVEGGERKISHMLVTETAIPYGCRLWLPGTDTANVEESYEVVHIRTAPNLADGYRFYEIGLGP